MWICAAALLALVVRAVADLGAPPRRVLAVGGCSSGSSRSRSARSCSRATTSGPRPSPPPRSPRSSRAGSGSGWPCSGSPSPRRSTRSSSCLRSSSTSARRHGRREAAIAAGRLRRRARPRRRSLRAHRPGRACRLARPPARPAASDREPRRLGAPGRAPARPLRAHGRLDARLPEPRRLAAGCARHGADRRPGGSRSSRVWLALRARARRRPRGWSPPAPASVVVFVAFGKVLSPQFLIWLVPRRAARRWARSGSPPAGSSARRLVTTHLWFPTRYWDMVDLQPVGWLVLVRNVFLVALAVVLGASLRHGHAHRLAARSAPVGAALDERRPRCERRRRPGGSAPASRCASAGWRARRARR